MSATIFDIINTGNWKCASGTSRERIIMDFITWQLSILRNCGDVGMSVLSSCPTPEEAVSGGDSATCS